MGTITSFFVISPLEGMWNKTNGHFEDELKSSGHG